MAKKGRNVNNGFSNVLIEGLHVGKKSQGDVLDYVVNEFLVPKLETVYARRQSYV